MLIIHVGKFCIFVYLLFIHFYGPFSIIFMWLSTTFWGNIEIGIMNLKSTI